MNKKQLLKKLGELSEVVGIAKSLCNELNHATPSKSVINFRNKILTNSLKNMEGNTNKVLTFDK